MLHSQPTAGQKILRGTTKETEIRMCGQGEFPPVFYQEGMIYLLVCSVGVYWSPMNMSMQNCNRVKGCEEEASGSMMQ